MQNGEPYVQSKSFLEQYDAETWFPTRLESDQDVAAMQVYPYAVFRQYPEDEKRYQAIVDEIDKYVANNFIAFVTGRKSFEEYPEFIERCHDLGIEEAKEILNEARRKLYTKPLS